MTEVKKTIGANIRNERQKRDMSLEDLAEMLNITSGFLGLVERGHRGTDISYLVEISKIFGISLDTLVIDRDKVNNPDPASQVRESKRANIYSSLYDMDEAELNFVISIIHPLKKLRPKG